MGSESLEVHVFRLTVETLEICGLMVPVDGQGLRVDGSSQWSRVED